MTTKEKPKVSVKKLIGGGYNRFWHNKQFYRVVKGSRGSKKSKNTALNFIYRIMKYPWANLLVIRRYSNTNKQSTYTDLKWAANRLEVSHLFKFNESLPEITYLPTGQKILFRGLDDELKITSITVDVGILCWLWVEEAYQIEKADKLRTVVESIRGSHESPDFFKQITLTFNPWSERHWLKEMFFDEETREKDVFSDTTTFRVNEWLDDVDRARYMDLYRTNPRRARIVCDGDWGVAEGLVFENFEVRDFDIQETIKRIQETTQGMDFGFTNDPTTIVGSAVDLKNKEIYIYDEHYEKAMLTDDIYSMIQSKGLLKASITADNSDPRTIEELRRKGVRRIHRAVKKADSIKHGIQWLQGFKIYIHPSCVHTEEEFNTYVFDQDKEGNWLNVPVDANNHIIDALRYSMERYHLGKSKDAKKTHSAFKKLGL
ncbi:putative terminase, large subunit - phage associated [Oceanobacillus oncorhynchi subsp. incaldanensis]|uniref:PBSX family phage terminase large subunit n=1 Tax=Oceanobacillus oncorhynchi TaxID=545501 RepID=UPI001B289F38|nr:PBSX family phage terminase large subunit [Oceanobacillus oncorhynchi]GIO18143.1 putative terminase, large subunit - phage associated [Oceanobacillus oncorhynchi subsp. incaldanensis]